ncbi:MAG: AzlD domain-containing protein [Clostridia bacterium]|nr:AzlD domain-containing protein [Clostridia bacterium]
MNLSYLLISALLMFVATLAPRFIPFVFIRRKITSPFWKSFLYYLPYAVLAALTFPYVLYSTGSLPAAAIATAAALAMSFFELNMASVAALSFLIAVGLGFVF